MAVSAQDQAAHRVEVDARVERDAALPAGRVVAQSIGRPGMQDLVDREAHQQHDGDDDEGREECLRGLRVHQRLAVPITGDPGAPASWRRTPASVMAPSSRSLVSCAQHGSDLVGRIGLQRIGAAGDVDARLGAVMPRTGGGASRSGAVGRP